MTLADLIPADASLLDHFCLAWFLLVWLGYGKFIHSAWAAPNVTSRMIGVRRAWMRAMLGRDNRITDASLLGSTMHSGTFFASTTMIALAALLGLLGKLDVAHAVINDLSFATASSRRFLELKVLLLIGVFAHTFLKLTWALRQLNYCLALIGGAPLKPTPSQRDNFADRIATVLSLSISSFNAGIRGYYFALAGMAWFMGPLAFLAATCGMLAMLLWRQFGSATARAIESSDLAYAGLEDQRAA